MKLGTLAVHIFLKKIRYVSTKCGLHGVKGRIIENLVLLYQIMIHVTKVQNDGVEKTVANVRLQSLVRT